MNNFQLATALVLDPKRAMGEIEQRPRFLFPLLVTIVVTVAALFWYYSIVDIEWLKDATIRANPRMRALPEDQLANVTRAMSKGVLMWSALIIGPLVVVIIRLLEATWYLLAGKVTNVQRSYKQWFALAAWTSLPGILALLPAIPLLLTTKSAQIDAASAIAPLSLNELFLHRAMGDPGYQLFTQINVIQLFTMFLVVLGIKLWSGRSWLFALVYALLPVVLIGGTWAFFSLK